MKIRIQIEIEDDGGEIVDCIVKLVESMGKPAELPEPKPRRFEDTPPAVNISPLRRRVRP